MKELGFGGLEFLGIQNHFNPMLRHTCSLLVRNYVAEQLEMEGLGGILAEVRKGTLFLRAWVLPPSTGEREFGRTPLAIGVFKPWRGNMVAVEVRGKPFGWVIPSGYWKYTHQAGRPGGWFPTA